MKPPFAANLFPHLSPASPPSPPLSLRGKAITRDALGTRDGGFTERGPKVGEQGGPSCLSAFFDRERAKKKKGRGTHLFSSDLLAGVLWDIRARQWIVALAPPPAIAIEAGKRGSLGESSGGEKDAFSLASPFAARRRRRFVGVDFQSDDLFGLTLFSNLASVEQFPSNSSPTRAPLTQGELDWRRNRAESEREEGGERARERALLLAQTSSSTSSAKPVLFVCCCCPKAVTLQGKPNPQAPKGLWACLWGTLGRSSTRSTAEERSRGGQEQQQRKQQRKQQREWQQ